MGYISKDMAVITEPDIVTLSATPNFVQFESKPATKTYLELNVQAKVTRSTPGDIPALTLLRITDATGTPHDYSGTLDASKAGVEVFYVSDVTSDTAENLRQVLLADSWFSANFDAVIPFVWVGSTPTNGSVLNIKSKGAGTDFNIQVTAPNDTSNRAYQITWVNQTSQNNDSITGGASTVQIDLDVYTDPDVFLGQDDKPVSAAKLGTYAVTLSKTYAGFPLWFELNALFSRHNDYNTPTGAPGWFDTGTVQVYRFTAKVKAINSFYFYQSNALFVLHGYGPASEDLDMSPYVYEDGGTVTLLTNKPRTPYVKGQKEYLNFILKDPLHGAAGEDDFTLAVRYRALSTGGREFGNAEGQPINRTASAIVNTCELDIDAILDQYPNTSIVRVGLMRDGELISNEIEYAVQPECLHTLRQFSFLNRLGGWDAFNFDAGVREDIKPSVETYSKTITPAYRRGDSIETVYATSLADTFTIEGAPVTDEVADWLKELATARVILDGDGNRIIIEDFTLQKTDANRNMQRPAVKYRLSETYTND